MKRGRPRQPTHLIPTGLERDLLSALELILKEWDEGGYDDIPWESRAKATRTRRINKARWAVKKARSTKKFVKIWTQKKEITK